MLMKMRILIISISIFISTKTPGVVSGVTIGPGNASKIVTLSLNFGTISIDTWVSVLVITTQVLVPYTISK